MDISQFPQSKNVEDERTGLVGELVNYLLHPVKEAYSGIVNHPFQTSDQYYRDLYSKVPQEDLSNTPLASSIGMGATVRRPLVDPAHIQALLDQLKPAQPGDKPRYNPLGSLGAL